MPVTGLHMKKVKDDPANTSLKKDLSIDITSDPVKSGESILPLKYNGSNLSAVSLMNLYDKINIQ